MDNRPYFIVGGVALAFLLLIIINQPESEGPDVADVVAEQLAPISDNVAELGDRVSGMESTLTELSDRVEEAVTSDDLAEVQTQIETALTETGALQEQLAGVQGSLDAATDAMSAATDDSAAAPQDAPATEEAVTPPADAPEIVIADGEGVGPGETALFADGTLRLFVSRIDPTAKEVRVSVSGEMKTLAQGQARVLAAGDAYCRITPETVAANAVSFTHLCGDDLPAPEGLSAGETALFEDGALRVFASRMDEDEARLFINQEPHTIALGRSVPAMAGETACRVYLDALDRGHATVSAQCGEDVAVSDAVGPGRTVILGDGAARVFVASVQEDMARFAINGQTVLSGASGDSIPMDGGCAVTVEDVMEGAASFSYACN